MLTRKTNKQPTTRTAAFAQLNFLKEKFDVNKPIGAKLYMYHVKSLNKEMSDVKSLMEESIISEYSEEFHLSNYHMKM